MSFLNKLIIGTLGTTVGIGLTADIIENKMKNYDTIVEKPIDTVSIIIPTYNESMFVEKSLQSIKNQSIVDQYSEMFEYILIDSGSKDGTIELAKPLLDIAKKVRPDRVVLTDKRGKLTARNIATDVATGNIIVSVDADCIYPYHFLNALLKPFKDSTVIAVNGATMDYSIPGIPGKLYTFLAWLEKNYKYVNRLHGRHSAYRKDAFYQIGKFSESINQFNVKAMNIEEEIEFGNKLAKLGKVEWKLNASCQHLGGLKMSCRNAGLKAFTSNNACNKYGIGMERFG